MSLHAWARGVHLAVDAIETDALWALYEPHHPDLADLVCLEGAFVVSDGEGASTGLALDGARREVGFALELTGERALLAIEHGGVARLDREWREVVDEAAVAGCSSSLELRPALASCHVGGAVATIELPGVAEGAVSLFVRESARGVGFSDGLVDLVDRRGLSIAAPLGGALASFCAHRGFGTEGERGGFALLTPPSRRPPGTFRLAASVALVDVPGAHVLLGRRLVPPWQGCWAFPGGSVEQGEEVLAGALRELEEETGLAVAPLEAPLRVETVHVAAGFEAVPYAVTNFAFATVGRPEAAATRELEAHWFPLSWAASGLRPVAAGTRRVLRALASRYGSTSVSGG